MTRKRKRYLIRSESIETIVLSSGYSDQKTFCDECGTNVNTVSIRIGELLFNERTEAFEKAILERDVHIIKRILGEPSVCWPSLLKSFSKTPALRQSAFRK